METFPFFFSFSFHYDDEIVIFIYSVKWARWIVSGGNECHIIIVEDENLFSRCSFIYRFLFLFVFKSTMMNRRRREEKNSRHTKTNLNQQFVDHYEFWSIDRSRSLMISSSIDNDVVNNFQWPFQSEMPVVLKKMLRDFMQLCIDSSEIRTAVRRVYSMIRWMFSVFVFLNQIQRWRWRTKQDRWILIDSCLSFLNALSSIRC